MKYYITRSREGPVHTMTDKENATLAGHLDLCLAKTSRDRKML